jgi:hypothetical protein
LRQGDQHLDETFRSDKIASTFSSETILYQLLGITLVHSIRLKHGVVPLLHGSSFALREDTDASIPGGSATRLPRLRSRAKSKRHTRCLTRLKSPGMHLLLLLILQTSPFTLAVIPHEGVRTRQMELSEHDKRVLLRHVSHENISRWQRLVQTSIRILTVAVGNTTFAIQQHHEYQTTRYTAAVPTTIIHSLHQRIAWSSQSDQPLPTQHEDQHCHHRYPALVGLGERMERAGTGAPPLPGLRPSPRSHSRVSTCLLRWMASSQWRG